MAIAKQRVIVYIDGFNLYFGIRDANWRRYLWLDVVRLAQNLLHTDQELVGVKYFTARIRGDQNDPNFRAKRQRQNRYLDALQALANLTITEGKYLLKAFQCKNCGVTSRVPTEKMTDVNISVSMLEDADDNSYDTALLISADGDLAPAIRSIRGRYPHKRIVAVFPPRRSAFELQNAANAYFTIGRRVLARSQFANEVTNAAGVVLHKPATWNR
ncbi:NYN domain-containing protein [bacterium]|nr:NYN domain-containing protein [bacterium]